MVLALNVTVLAADTYTITINYSGSGHTYEAYQIFSGTLSYDYSEYTGDGTDGTTVYTYDSKNDEYTVATYDGTSGTTYYYATGKVLSDIQWGSGVKGSALLAALTDNNYAYYTNFKDCTTAADVADVLSTAANDSALAESFAQLASENLTTAVAGTSTETASPYTITGLSAGYYLVKDKDGSVTAEGDSYTDIILEVVADVEVDAKADTTTVDKKVDSETDSNNETTADYDIGDDVPFTLIANLPSNYASYTTYKLTFHDTLSTGLSFNNDVDVSVYTAYTGLTTFGSDTYYYTYDTDTGEFSAVDSTSTPDSTATYYTKTTVVGGYSVATSIQGTLSDSTCTFEVQIADTNSLTDVSSTITVASTSKIVVEYTAELLSTAATEETNAVKLDYSNNPNKDGTGTTTEDKTTVFTFTLDVTKVDEDGSTLLSGAGFTLYKAEEQSGLNSFSDFVTDTTYYTIDSSGTPTAVDTTNDTFESNTAYYVYEEVAELTSGTTFTFKGLGVGYYKLVESTTPTGYNTMDDMYFTIEAETEEDAYGNASVKSLTIKDSDGNVISAADDSKAFIINTADQSISTDIENHKGSTLPSTGGIGTTIFYVVGGVMVVGALTLLITRLRMRKRKSI
ncbi:MAG: isopeptide-forming domain-containing fimbrial protein [Oscillospiraceae bacterium]|nr:isopeptide-forming domain-containing fimbrial protein [Oscillospiraceae bacterium]